MAFQCSARLTLSFILLFSLVACTYNPFSTHNHLTGSAAGTAIGAGAGVGTAALVGASKPEMLIAGLVGGTIGYYVTTLTFDQGGVTAVGGQVYTLGDYVTVEIPTDKIFDSNTSDLLPEAKPVLDSTVKVLNRYPNTNIMISGNTSGYGTQKFEKNLSEARAREVAAYLWAHGINNFKNQSISTRKLTYVGYGNYFPIANNIRVNSIRSNSRIQITAYPCDADLHLDKKHQVFHNVGALNEAPIAQSNASQADTNDPSTNTTLAENSPEVMEAFNGD